MLVSQRTLATRFQGLAAALAGKPIFWLVFIVTLFTWPIWRSIVSERDLPSRHRPLLGLVRDFTLRDQGGGELGAAELRGRLWVASFTAVDCEPMCTHAERVMATMAELGVTGLLELPPAGTLTGIAKRNLKGVELFALNTPDQLPDAAAFIASHGGAR